MFLGECTYEQPRIRITEEVKTTVTLISWLWGLSRFSKFHENVRILPLNRLRPSLWRCVSDQLNESLSRFVRHKYLLQLVQHNWTTYELVTWPQCVYPNQSSYGIDKAAMRQVLNLFGIWMPNCRSLQPGNSPTVINTPPASKINNSSFSILSHRKQRLFP